MEMVTQRTAQFSLAVVLSGTVLWSMGGTKSSDAGAARTDLGPVVDLSHTLQEGMPVYPGSEPFRLKNVLTIEKSKLFYMNTLSMGEHTGTHVDAPSHAASRGANVEALSL